MTKDIRQESRIARRGQVLPAASGGAARPSPARCGRSPCPTARPDPTRPGSRPPPAGAEAPDRTALTMRPWQEIAGSPLLSSSSRADAAQTAPPSSPPPGCPLQL
eukprot:GHVT01103567.1.p5 GENE.GHVT01103567.1~~GHVT01103567.1.p5  ORF type:complete len:105 (-),score=20.47 GHVT01103567.1:2121-2435(-)